MICGNTVLLLCIQSSQSWPLCHALELSCISFLGQRERERERDWGGAVRVHARGLLAKPSSPGNRIAHGDVWVVCGVSPPSLSRRLWSRGLCISHRRSRIGREVAGKRCSSDPPSALLCEHKISTVCLFAGCLSSQQHASVSQGRICTDNFTCCHTEVEAADQTFHLTQSQYTDTGPTSPSADPVTPGAWQGSHWSANFEVTGMTRPRKNPGASGIWTRDLALSRLTP